MTRALLLGVDVGTTSVKAVVFSDRGVSVASGKQSTPWTTTDSGAETDALALRDTAFAAIRSALNAAPEGQIAGVGIASLAESGVLLDENGSPLAPVIAWYDRRDDRELEELRTQLGDRFSAVTGLPLAQQWSLTKSRWLNRHHADAVARARLRLSVGEWIAYALGGHAASEPSLASRTGVLALADREWWDEALDFAAIDARILPPLADAGTDLGAVRAGVHERLTGARIAVAGHDHQAAAVGAGAWSSGDTLDSCGTAEALVRTADVGIPAARITQLADGGVTVGWHALPGHWCLLGATEGGRALGLVLAGLGVSDLTDGIDAKAQRLALARDAGAIEHNAAIEPVGSMTTDHEATERTAAALAAGGDAPARLWLGTIEQITAEAVALDRLMTEAAGDSERFLAVGGWTASEALIDAKRRQFGRVDLPEITEAGARGAALFAGIAAGMWNDAARSSF